MANTIGVLQVTPEEMQNAAAQLSGYLKTMEEAFASMKKTMAGTAWYWGGEAGDAHRRLFEGQISKTEEIIARYQEHITDLNAMSGVYSQAEQTAAAAAEQLPVSNL